jgi:hypothetical protein
VGEDAATVCALGHGDCEAGTIWDATKKRCVWTDAKAAEEKAAAEKAAADNAAADAKAAADKAAADECNPAECKTWGCSEWCTCFDIELEREGIYLANGCEDDDSDDTCNCE